MRQKILIDLIQFVKFKIYERIFGFKIRRIIKSIILFIKSLIIYPFVNFRKYNYSHYLSVCAIAKNEADYIAEWIEYHLLVGVTKFYIYDNDSTDNMKQILEPYIKSCIVEYKLIKGSFRQLPAYNDCLKKARKETRFLAFIDIDEFIRPISTKTIPELLKFFENSCGLEISWLIYGSNGHKEKKDGLVIERFTKHSKFDFAQSRHVKTISNTKKTIRVNVHQCEYFFWQKAVNSDNKKSKKLSGEKEPVFNKIVINHYRVKSFEEYQARIKNPGGNHYNTKTKSRSIDSFNFCDCNEEEDFSLLEFVPIIKKKIKNRGIY